MPTGLKGECLTAVIEKLLNERKYLAKTHLAMNVEKNNIAVIGENI